MTRLLAIAWLAACSTPPPAPVTGWQDISATELATELTGATGRTRVVNFWATWCAPCLHEIPELVRYNEEHPEVDVVFVSIDHPSVRARGEAALEQVGLAHQRVLHLGEPDPTQTLRTHVAGWSDAVPFTAVVSPQGERMATFAYTVDAAVLDEAVTGVAP